MIMKLKSHKDLLVWKKAMNLVEVLYKTTKDFPREEIDGPTSQIRRASISIPANITEGYQRKYIKEYVQFLYIAKSSASEVETLIERGEAPKLHLGESAKTETGNINKKNNNEMLKIIFTINKYHSL